MQIASKFDLFVLFEPISFTQIWTSEKGEVCHTPTEPNQMTHEYI